MGQAQVRRGLDQPRLLYKDITAYGPVGEILQASFLCAVSSKWPPDLQWKVKVKPSDWRSLNDERAEDEDNGPAASGIRVHRYDHYDDFFDYEDAEDYFDAYH